MGDELPTGWMQQARCKGSAVFQELSYSETAADIRSAKRFCADCQVKYECLSYAILTRESFGVWGGQSAPDRKKMLAYGSAFSGFQDELRHQLIVKSPEPETAADDPATWDWSI